MEKVYVDGHPHLYRDRYSGAIVNENNHEYEMFMKAHEMRLSKSKRVDKIEEDLHNLKSEISEIKHLLLKLNERTIS